MINVEPCRGCGRIILTMAVANLAVRVDPEPLDAQTATAALLAGRELWTASPDGQQLHGASNADLMALSGPPEVGHRSVLGSHRCPNGSRGPVRAQQRVGEAPVPKAPPGPPVAPSRPSSGPSRATSTVPVAANRRTEGRTECSTCGRPIDLTDVGTYALFEIGAVLIDAFHTTCD